MSIATDEADSVADEQMMSHFYYSDSPLSFPEAKYFGKDMYVAGRTAEPTEAEIKAVIRAMYYRYAADWESDEARARYILEAARKAVAE